MMTLADIHTCFSGNPLDRADQLRTDPEIFGSYLTQKDARVVLMAEDKILSNKDGTIAWRLYSDCADLPLHNTLFLGLDNKAPRYAVHLQGSVEDHEANFCDLETETKFRDGRTLGFKLNGPHPSLGIVAQAKSMLLWHESHRYCAQCGAESHMIKAGYERLCGTCGASHFPRTDPVVIMLARHGDKALVGRGPDWPENHFSALAGFMEPGESMEEAVARELHEEVGLHTTKVSYVASQPWPWPSSLMIGTNAWVNDTDLVLDTTEIAEAVWVTKKDVLASIEGNHKFRLLPPPYAIARNLIKAWLEE